MSGTDHGSKGRRWWEMRGGGEPDESRYGDLVTGGRGRTRPERSLSIGANSAAEHRHPLHRFLWPVVSVVVIGALIVGGVYGVPRLRSEGASESTSRAATALDSKGDAEGDAPGLPPPMNDAPSAGGPAPQPFGGTTVLPGGLGSTPGGNPGVVGDSGDDQSGEPLSRPNASPPAQQEGPAPPNPAPAKPAPVPDRDRLFVGEQLNAGQQLVSPNGEFVLLMQDNGNLVEYVSGGSAVWATGTSAPDSILKVQDDGNIVIIAPGNQPMWATGTDGNPNVTLELQDDGNLVVYAEGHQAVWSSGVP